MYLPLLQILCTALPTHVLSHSQRQNKTKNEIQKKTNKKTPIKPKTNMPQTSLLVYSFSAWDVPWSVVDMPSDTPL